MCLSFAAGDEGSEAFLPYDEPSQALYFVSLTQAQLNSVFRGCLGKRAAGPKTPNPKVPPLFPQLGWALQERMAWSDLAKFRVILVERGAAGPGQLPHIC